MGTAVTPINETIQKFVSRRLRELGITQRDLGRALSRDSSNISRWLNGGIHYKAAWINENAPMFAQVLQCEENEILSRIEATMASAEAEKSRGVQQSPMPLNRDMLKALSEIENPSDEMMKMLEEIEYMVGGKLPYDLCASLLRIFCENNKPDLPTQES